MKNAIAIVTLSALLSACSALAPLMPEQPSTQKATPTSQANPADDAISEPNAKSTDALPSIELSKELLFKLLSSELAYQRGQWQSAYITLLGAAQETRDPRLAKRAAEMAMGSKQGAEALDAIRLWRQLAPNSEEATQYYLGFTVLSDKIAEAQPIFEQLLKDARPQSRGLMIFQFQRMLARAKDKDRAFAMLQDVLAPYPMLLETHLALALGAFHKGDAATAAEEGKLALAIKPDSEMAVLMLAQASNDQKAAAAQMADFLQSHPHAREVRTAYARILANLKQFEQARNEFEELLKTQPDDLNALYALGVLSTQSDKPKEAEAYFTRYLKALGNHPGEGHDPTTVQLILAQLAEGRGDTAAALKWLAELDPSEKQSPVYFGTQIKRAQLIAKRGDLAAARKLLDDLNPDGKREQVQVVLAQSQLLREANQLPAALALLEIAMKRFPSEPDLFYDHAMVADKLDRVDVMEKSLRQVIVLAPENQHAYNALGYALAERNIRLDEAYMLIDKALKLAPEDPFIMDSMGWVQFRMGHLKEAEQFLRRTYKIRQDPDIAVHLGEVLWVQGHKDDAKKLWRDAQLKDPKNDTLIATLARLKVGL